MTTIALACSIPWGVRAEAPFPYLFQRGDVPRLDGPLVPAALISP
jgi:hypothetical protein